MPDVKQIFETCKLSATDEKLEKVIALVKERCTLLTDFVEQAKFFFQTPQQWDLDAIKPKWNDAKQAFFGDVITYFQNQTSWNVPTDLENGFKELAAAKQIKPGEVLLPLRIMLVGVKFGPGVFDIASIIGKEETILRIRSVLEKL
jgi:glutamyl-tRNA synthetase